MHRGFAYTSLLAFVGLIGCGPDYNDRPPPTKEAVQEADQKRQSVVDSATNMSPEAKAQMKAHLGGPAAPPPAGKPQNPGPSNTRAPEERK